MQGRQAFLVCLLLILATAAAAHTASTQRAPPAYKPAPPSTTVDLGPVEDFCPKNDTWASWRQEQTVNGVHMQADRSCRPDRPKVVAAVTMGTNRMPEMWRMQTGLSEEAVWKGKDRDNDGDPDVINITMEVAEINGNAASSGVTDVQQAIAPGIKPGFWVFAPKTFGMATEGSSASNIIRMPSPAIRVEQGDRVKVNLENTHYMPHTIHFHGVDHSFMVNGSGNDGVPQTSESPVLPGEEHTYEFRPTTPGSFFYHCHVQPDIHVLMGLQGMFTVAEERANNTVQTYNIGNGKVRHPSEAVKEEYESAYDLQYQGIDHKLHQIINISNDPRVVSKMMNRGYDSTERNPDYYLLNGKSFPYTIRESQLIVEPDERYKLRILNGGSETVQLHTHGHKGTITHRDGVKDPAPVTRDVYTIGAAQRLDIALNTTIDGFNSYGKGVWFMHSHKEEQVTNNGITPGGNIGLITYKSYLKENGFPVRHGVSWEPYFTEGYYERQVPVWQSYSPTFLGGIAELPAPDWPLAAAAIVGLFAGVGAVLGWRRWSA